MFLCDPCMRERGVDPQAVLFRSYGVCEGCDKVESCGDIPSAYLAYVAAEMKAEMKATKESGE